MAHDDMIRNDKSRSDFSRPVSGEIMSATPLHTGMTSPYRDYESDAETICDAQFETLSQAGPHTGPQTDPAILTSDTDMRYRGGLANISPAPGMEFLTKGETTRHGAKGGPLFWLASLSAVAFAFWISGGHALMADMYAPATGARLPLQIAGVASRVEAHGGRNLLFVDGRAENHGNHALALPAIEIAVTGNDGAVTRYQLAGREMRLEPGHRHEFSSRLQAPGGGVKTVSVAFAEEGR